MNSTTPPSSTEHRLLTELAQTPILCTSPSGATVPPSASRAFGDAERLLLAEARARFDFEQKSAGALHTKNALYLTVTGVFAALAASSIGRLLDQPSRGAIAIAAVVVFVLCLGIFVQATILLTRSALSQTYQVIAAPRAWAQHLAALRSGPVGSAEGGNALLQLEWDLLDAWMEAAEACALANAAKAATLHRVARLINAAVALGFLGILLLLLHSMFR